jgi:hypothetical protein
VRLLLVVLGLFLAATSGAAQEKTGNREGFELKPGTVRIALLEPSVRVGSQSTGGMFEPNADWTVQAKESIEAELAKKQASLGNEVVSLKIENVPQAGELIEYHALFGAVASSVIEYEFFPGNRLPTKKKSKAFEWSVGPGLSEVPALQGFDYVLIIRTRDAFGSTGRKLLQVAGLFGAAFGLPTAVQSGEHVGMAGLVEVKTGDLVWLNADLAMGGDPREPDGAVKRVTQLLEGFPGSTENAD